VPGAGHGSGGRIGTRKRNDYFVRYLHGVEPPRWNALDVAENASVPEPADAADAPEAWLELPASEAPPLADEWR
jgi:hypothetical protein